MYYSNSIEQTAHEQRYRVQRLIGQYMRDPVSFQPSQVDELKEMANGLASQIANRLAGRNVA